MDIVISNLVIGISFGFILFLLGTGLSLTMGLMRVINLAHGAIYMVGAYVAHYITTSTGSFLLGILAGGVVGGLLGILMERGFLQRLYKREMDQVLLTIGFVYVLTNVTQWIWGPVPKSGIVPALFAGSVPVGIVNIPIFRLSIIGIGILALIILWLFQEKTRVGAMIRAGMDNKEMTMGLGINLQVIFTAVFALGTFVAGFCGLFGAQNLGVNLAIGWDALLLAMIVVIIGGVGSVQGALAGGLIVGLVDAFGKAFFPDFAHFSIYVVLIIILLLRPGGLLGRRI